MTLQDRGTMTDTKLPPTEREFCSSHPFPTHNYSMTLGRKGRILWFKTNSWIKKNAIHQRWILTEVFGHATICLGWTPQILTQLWVLNSIMMIMFLPTEGSARNLLDNAQLEKVQYPLLLGLPFTHHIPWLLKAQYSNTCVTGATKSKQSHLTL